MPYFLNFSRHLCFTIALLCVITGASGMEPPKPFILKGDEVQSLRQHLEFLEDPRGQFTVDNVASGQAGAFQPIESLKYVGFPRTIYWVRVTLDFSHFNEPYSFFKKEYQHIGALTVFYPSDKGFMSVGIDEKSPIEGRAYGARDYLFKIPTPNAKTIPTTYYVKFDPRGHLTHIDLSWGSVKGIINHIQISQLWMGLFFGSLLVMWFYNAFLYAYTRNSAYLYYIYYLACFIAIFVDLNGFKSLLFHISPNYGKFFVLCVYGTLHGISLFVRYFLNLAPTLRWMDAYLKHAKWGLLYGAISAFVLPIGQAYHISIFAVLAIIPAVFIAGVWRWRQGYEAARLYCLGWGLFALAIIAYSLQSLGLLPVDIIITTYGLQAGAVWEVVFFSLALGYRLKLRDREAAMAKNAFLGMISHELKTPLQTIVSSIDLLSVRKFDAAKDKVMERLRVAAEHLEMQMRDLTDYARLDANKLQLRPARFNASKMIRTVTAEYRSMAEAKGLIFETDIEEHKNDILSDSLRIQQIVNNLIINAIKYTEKGRVGVRLRYLHESPLSLVITVEDSGTGIHSKNVPTLFEPFTQMDQSSTRRHDGIGMGLAIVKRLVDLFGGSIKVESNIGKGTTFEIHIPVEKAATYNSDNMIDDGCESSRILLVDDNADVRIVLKQIVETLYYCCDVVASGQEAINHTINRRYDAILLDINMPGMDGFSVAQTIRGTPCPNQNVPIIWISATAPQVSSPEQQQLFSYFLEKPVHANKLNTMLKQILN